MNNETNIRVKRGCGRTKGCHRRECTATDAPWEEDVDLRTVRWEGNG